MYLVRRIAMLTLVTVAAAAVVACDSGDEPKSESSSAIPTPYPSGTVVVEPLETIPGAERLDVDGVGIDIMPGYTTMEVGNQPEQTLIQIGREGDELAVASLAVTRLSHLATDVDLDTGFDLFHQLAPAQRGTTDIVDTPLVIWDAVEHPLGLHGVDHPTVDTASDLRWIGGREADGDRLISVQVWATPGTDIEDSDGWQMARTVRFDSEN